MAVIPAKAGIQYAAAPRFHRWRLGILDHPFSRMMTAMNADGPAQQKGRLKSRPPEFNESRSHTQRACLGGGIALGDLAPVHGIPPGLEVIGTAVLGTEIVSVVPDVASHEHAAAVPVRSVPAPGGPASAPC